MALGHTHTNREQMVGTVWDEEWARKGHFGTGSRVDLIKVLTPFLDPTIPPESPWTFTCKLFIA